MCAIAVLRFIFCLVCISVSDFRLLSQLQICVCQMNGLLADPLCPVSLHDGSPPLWLRLCDYPGGGREWFCSLCEQWAAGNHLSGRRHQKRLWHFDERCQSGAQLSAAASDLAQDRATHLSIMEPLPILADSSSADVGAISHSGCNLACGASQDLVSGFVHAHNCRITTLAQFAPSVVEELLALALERLESNVVR
jgi:hypothetical protein